MLPVLSRSETSIVRFEADPTITASKLTILVASDNELDSFLSPMVNAPELPDLVGVAVAFRPKVARGLVSVMDVASCYPTGFVKAGLRAESQQPETRGLAAGWLRSRVAVRPATNSSVFSPAAMHCWQFPRYGLPPYSPRRQTNAP